MDSRLVNRDLRWPGYAGSHIYDSNLKFYRLKPAPVKRKVPQFNRNSIEYNIDLDIRKL